MILLYGRIGQCHRREVSQPEIVSSHLRRLPTIPRHWITPRPLSGSLPTIPHMNHRIPVFWRELSVLSNGGLIKSCIPACLVSEVTVRPQRLRLCLISLTSTGRRPIRTSSATLSKATTMTLWRGRSSDHSPLIRFVRIPSNRYKVVC